jgi:hypothetical protein
MHTDEAHTVDLSANPIRITGDTGYMDLHVLAPEFGALVRTLDSFDNGHDDPDATVISLATDTTEAMFSFLFMPAAAGATNPPVAIARHAWGVVSRIGWSGGVTDMVAVNETDTLVGFDHDGTPVVTDAAIAVFRDGAQGIDRYLATRVTLLVVGADTIAAIADGAASVTVSTMEAHIDRPNARFRLYAPGVTAVWFDDLPVPFQRDGPYILSDTATDGDRPPRFGPVTLRVFPSPFQTSTRIEVDAPVGIELEVAVFDAAGRRVATLVRGDRTGDILLDWDGASNGRRMASGVYFVRAKAGAFTASRKVVLIR